MDCAPSVIATIHRGRERPATKKFSALPWTKNKVAMPIKKLRAMAAMMAMLKPKNKKWKEKAKIHTYKYNKFLGIQRKRANIAEV